MSEDVAYPEANEIVSIEAAELAKELGFNWQVRNFFKKTESQRKKWILTSYIGETPEKMELLFDWNAMGKKLIPDLWVSAPSQSILMRWIRETFNIVLYVMSDGPGKLNQYVIKWADGDVKEERGPGMKIYEDAVDNAIIQALRLVKATRVIPISHKTR